MEKEENQVEKKEMWLCPYCGMLNEKTRVRCGSCGEDLVLHGKIVEVEDGKTGKEVQAEQEGKELEEEQVLPKENSAGKRSKKRIWLIVPVIICILVLGYIGKTTLGGKNYLMEDRVAEGDEKTVFGSTYSRSSIYSVTFLDTLKGMPDTAWDVSANGDKTVMAWVNEYQSGQYQLYIAANGVIEAPKDCHTIFAYYHNVQEIIFNGVLSTGRTESMRGMFSNCENLRKVDVEGFDTSKVTDMYAMFNECGNLQVLDVSGFDTSAVTDMSYMFRKCSALTSLDVSGFDTSAVTNMYCMFGDCSSLLTLDVSGFDTSAVTNMGYMFKNCSALTQLQVSGFETLAVKDMSYMFYNCNNLTSDADQLKIPDGIETQKMYSKTRWEK